MSRKNSWRSPVGQLVRPGEGRAVHSAGRGRLRPPGLAHQLTSARIKLKPHLASGVAASIEQVGARVRPLPPYSPDYTPIEEMFSKVKQGLRRAEARTEARLYEALGEALRRVTPKDIIGWFQHAGLCATHG
jgi:transposase